MAITEREPSGAAGAGGQRTENFVSFGHKLAYGIGGAVDLLAVWVLLAVAYPVFQMRLGMAPTLLASALLVFRLWDANGSSS